MAERVHTYVCFTSSCLIPSICSSPKIHVIRVPSNKTTKTGKSMLHLIIMYRRPSMLQKDNRHAQRNLPLRWSSRSVLTASNQHISRCRRGDLCARDSYSYCPPALKRSRDPAVLDACDIVVDVGAIYDESTLKFDHHQRGFTEVFGDGFDTKLSSAGLVYKWALLYGLLCLLVLWHISNRHFGQEVIANKIQASLDDPQVLTLWLKLYKVRDQF